MPGMYLWLLWPLLAKGSVTVLGNAWDVSVGYCGLYWPRVVHSRCQGWCYSSRSCLGWCYNPDYCWCFGGPMVVLQFWVLPRMFLWAVVVSTGKGWCYSHRECLGCICGLLWPLLAKGGITIWSIAWNVTVSCSGLLAKGGVMIPSTAWDFTMSCCGFYWPRVVLRSWILPGMLLWAVVTSAGQGWCYDPEYFLGCYCELLWPLPAKGGVIQVLTGMLLRAVVVSTGHRWCYNPEY